MAVSYSRDQRRSSAEEARVFETVWRRYQLEETDLLEGGVPLTAINRELQEIHRDVIRKILDRLADQGVLVRLDGADPDTLRSRHSFAPAALHDGGEVR